MAVGLVFVRAVHGENCAILWFITIINIFWSEENVLFYIEIVDWQSIWQFWKDSWQLWKYYFWSRLSLFWRSLGFRHCSRVLIIAVTFISFCFHISGEPLVVQMESLEKQDNAEVALLGENGSPRRYATSEFRQFWVVLKRTLLFSRRDWVRKFFLLRFYRVH